MAVQKNKVTRSRRNKRRAHDALLTIHSVECPNCGELKLPHHICGFCGFYRGQEILMAKESSLEEDEGY